MPLPTSSYSTTFLTRVPPNQTSRETCKKTGDYSIIMYVSTSDNPTAILDINTRFISLYEFLLISTGLQIWQK